MRAARRIWPRPPVSPDRGDQRAPAESISSTLPEHELVVRRVEPFRERSAGKAFYSAPGSGTVHAPASTTPISTTCAKCRSTRWRRWPITRAIPPSHAALHHDHDLEDIPAFRRFGGFTAYSEGWGALYRVSAAGDGLLRSPYSNFGRLAMELWRGLRASLSIPACMTSAGRAKRRSST